MNDLGLSHDLKRRDSCVGNVIQHQIRVSGIAEIICIAIFIELKRRAPREDGTADACHAVGDRDTRQSVAIVECIISYLLRTIGDHNLSLQQLSIDIEIVGIVHRIGGNFTKLYPEPSRQIALIVDIRQTAAIGECTDTDFDHAVGNRNACQAAASVECTVAYAGHAVPDRHACQTAASVECILTDVCHAVRDHDACQTVAIIECISSYLLRTIRNNNISLQQLPIDIEIVGVAHRINRGAIHVFFFMIKLYLRPSRQITLIVDIRQTAAF